MLEDKTGQKFPTLDLTEFGLAVPGMAVVASDDGIAKKGPALKNFLAANAKAIEMTRADPAAATAALKAVWQGGPSDKVVQQQIEATLGIDPLAERYANRLDRREGDRRRRQADRQCRGNRRRQADVVLLYQ